MKTQKGATLVGSLVAITILSTTLVSVLNLQASIIRSKFFLQYDNTANLLVAEGLEIVRAIYSKDGTVPNGKYQVDYKTTALDSNKTSICDDSPSNFNLNVSCDMDLATPQQSYGNNNFNGYVICQASGDCVSSTKRIFYRFVTIEPSSTPTVPKVTSTVVVENPKGGALRVYKATIELYKIN